MNNFYHNADIDSDIDSDIDPDIDPDIVSGHRVRIFSRSNWKCRIRTSIRTSCPDTPESLNPPRNKDSIRDGTTLPLYYELAPNEMLVPHETLDAEFLSLAEAEGVADIEELNKILDRAVNLKNFLKGKERIQKVAQFVAKHYRENVEPLGYKAFLVGVDREACAHYNAGELGLRHFVSREPVAKFRTLAGG